MFDDDDVGAMLDVGAPRRVMARTRGRGAAPMARARLPQSATPIRSAPPIMPGIPGANSVSMQELPLGFGNQFFNSSSASTVLTFTARPQAAFRGRRLVGSFTRTGASATGLLTVTSLLVGTSNQLIGTLGIPLDTFGAGAFGVDMVLVPAVPGIDITITVAVSALPGTTDRIDVGLAILGETIK